MENVMWEKKVYINLWQSGMRNIPGQGINQWVYSLKIQLDTSSLRLTYTKQLNNMKKQKTFIFEKGFFIFSLRFLMYLHFLMSKVALVAFQTEAKNLQQDFYVSGL